MVFDFWQGDFAPGQLVEGGDAPVGDAARHDQPEEVEVGRHVERKPVAGDPALNPDADGANLLGDDPSAGQPFDPPGLKPYSAVTRIMTSSRSRTYR